MSKLMFKGFDKNLKCRDFQYEVGKEYIHDGNIEVCESGFHACENPMDVFEYYPPANARYCEVTGDGKESSDKYGKKTSFEKIKINTEIGLGGIIKAGTKFCFDRVEWTRENTTTEYKSGASAEGNYSGASATGNCSGASAIGDYSGASATGNYSGASATGNYSGASAIGDYSGASAIGDYSVASATGDYSGASVTGNCSGASATGDYSGASVTGNYSGASTTGDWSGASATGYRSGASATGYYSVASVTGNCSGASATGYMSRASATGDYSEASVTGNCSEASAIGDYSGASAGKGSVAMAVGLQTRAKGEIGSWLVLTECKKTKDGKIDIKNVKVAKVDGVKIKADTWYTIEKGKFIEVNEEYYE